MNSPKLEAAGHDRGLRRPLALLALLGLPLVMVACSEKDKPEVIDETAPQVRVLFPVGRVDDNPVVADSTDVYAIARDESGVQRVEVYYRRLTDSEPQLSASTTTPITSAEIPDSLSEIVQVPAGWNLFRVRWRTLTIHSGVKPLLFARATDPRGNVGVSEAVTVLIRNRGDELVPPIVDFVVSPRDPKARQEVEFDPQPGQLTYDAQDPPERIELRWDFDGNANPDDPESGGWDTDWVRATQKQTRVFENQGTYHIQVIAKNSYLEEYRVNDTHSVRVRSSSGDPNPPEPDNYITLPAGEFTIGIQDTALVSQGVVDEDETPAFKVRFSGPVKIERTEVTNKLYLAYINAALAKGVVEFTSTGVYYKDRAAPKDTTLLYLTLDNSKIFYNLDTRVFQISDGFVDHPVTGVTYYGAEAYAFFYGLRLPYEAEWEAAARGDSTAWMYAWGRSFFDGDATGKARCNYSRSGDTFESGTTPAGYYNGTAYGTFQTVDTQSYVFPGEPGGMYDVAGNVSEWIGDWYAPYPGTLQQDYQGPSSGIFKVIRGGSYQSSVRGMRCTDRSAGAPLDASYPSVGFRTAYVPLR